MSVAWLVDLEAALARARGTKKLVLVHFTQAGRPLCEAMAKETLAAPPVIVRLGARFIAVKVDAAARPDVFASLVGGRGALATAVVDDGRDVVSVLPGFAPVDVFTRFLDDALAGYPRLLAARKVAARRPTDVTAQVELGDAYDTLGSDKRAQETFATVVTVFVATPPSVSPGPPSATARAVASAHERLARLLITRGRNLEARPHLDAYHALDPANHCGRLDRALVTEGLVLAVERSLRDARRILEDVRRRFPACRDGDRLLLALGLVHHELKDDAQALATLDELTRRYPRSRFVTAATDQIGHIRNPQADHQH